MRGVTSIPFPQRQPCEGLNTSTMCSSKFPSLAPNRREQLWSYLFNYWTNTSARTSGGVEQTGMWPLKFRETESCYQTLTSRHRGHMADSHRPVASEICVTEQAQTHNSRLKIVSPGFLAVEAWKVFPSEKTHIFFPTWCRRVDKGGDLYIQECIFCIWIHTCLFLCNV